MSTTKDELMNKARKIVDHHAGLLNLIHGIEDMPDIHFEIGHMQQNGESVGVYVSRDLTQVLKHWRDAGLKEQDGYGVDAWQDGKPVADIMMPLWAGGRGKKVAKVMFEINKKTISASGTVGDLGNPTINYDLETVFRSTMPEDCQREWAEKRYTKDDYVMDIRIAPEGKESYHFADIEVASMVDTKPKAFTDERLKVLDMLLSHKGKPLELAEAIVQMYKGDKS